MRCNLLLVEVECIDDERTDELPIVLRLTECIIEDVTRHHIWSDIIRLANITKLARCVLLILPLHILHHQILYL